MKYKGIFTIFIALVFSIITVLTVFSVFKIKKVDVSYEAFESGFNTVDGVDAELDQFVGKNLLFFDVDKVSDELKEYTRFEIVSIEKDFPNTLVVRIKERRERFFVENLGKNYVVSSDGFVLEEVVNVPQGLIELKSNQTLSGNKFEFVSVKVGEYLQTTDSDALNATLEIVNTEGVSGILTSVEVFSAFATNHLIMDTATEVNVEIVNFKNRGADKAQALINQYANINDYLKANSKIYVTESSETGEINTTWSQNG